MNQKSPLKAIFAIITVMKRLLILFILLLAPKTVAAAELPLEAPQNFRAQAIENLERVELIWEAPATAGVGYRIYRSTSKGNKGSILADSRAGLNYIDTTVAYSTTYYYTLASFLNTKVESTTAAMAVRPSLAAPGDVKAASTEQGGEIKLTWKRPTLGLILAFNIYRSTDDKGPGSRIAAQQAGEEYIDRTAENGRIYYYRVKAVGSSGREGEASALAIGVASDKKPPRPPTIKGSFSSPDKASLSWSAPAGERNLFYILYRSTSLGAAGDRVVETKNTSYRQAGLPPGAVYYYGVSAIDASGNVSELSQQVKITITAKASATASQKVQNFTAEGTTKAGEILLRWRLPADSKIAYSRIYRSLSPTGEAGQIADKVAGSSYLDKTAIAGQRYYYVARLVGKDALELPPSEQKNATAFDPANRSQRPILEGTKPAKISAPATPLPVKSAPSAGTKVYAYAKPRLGDLALEAALANNLRQALIKRLGANRVPWILNPTLVRAYLYGGYAIDEISRTITQGPGLVHPAIRAVEWRKSAEYQKKNK